MTLPPPVRPCVLVVEDEEGTRVALERWLAQDYDVVTARDGIEGLEIALTRDPMPDVILTDVWMPGLDGVSMVKCIKKNEFVRHVPVIFLTGQTAAKSVIAGIAAGAQAYLPKPIDLDTLERKLRSAIRSRKAGPSRPPP